MSTILPFTNLSSRVQRPTFAISPSLLEMSLRSSSLCATQGSAREYNYSIQIKLPVILKYAKPCPVCWLRFLHRSSSPEHISTETTTPQASKKGDLFTRTPPFTTSELDTAFITTGDLNTRLNIPEDFDYSIKHFNHDFVDSNVEYWDLDASYVICEDRRGTPHPHSFPNCRLWHCNAKTWGTRPAMRMR